MKRGFLHWVELDKRRPALILSTNARNELANDVIVLPCSSSTRPLRWHVELGRGEGGLQAATFIKCEQPATVRRELVSSAPIGRALSAVRMRQVEQAVLSAVGISL